MRYAPGNSKRLVLHRDVPAKQAYTASPKLSGPQFHFKRARTQRTIGKTCVTTTTAHSSQDHSNYGSLPKPPPNDALNANNVQLVPLLGELCTRERPATATRADHATGPCAHVSTSGDNDLEPNLTDTLEPGSRTAVERHITDRRNVDKKIVAGARQPWCNSSSEQGEAVLFESPYGNFSPNSAHQEQNNFETFSKSKKKFENGVKCAL